MSSSSVLEILVVVLLIFANSLFAMIEISIISARKVRLQQLANQGDIRAATALELANAPNRFLSTTQIGITLIGILAGAFGGATIANGLALELDRIPLLIGKSEGIALTLVVVVITYVSLVFGELVPKRLAMNNPEVIAISVAIPMQTLARIASPIVHLLSISTELILRLMGVQPSQEPEVTEEEIKVLIEQGTEAGTFEQAEQDMLQRVFRLGDRHVNALMTPRPDIVWLDLDDPIETNRQKIIKSSHSRLPVCQSGVDNVLGVIQISDLLSSVLSGAHLDLTSNLRRPLFVPESTTGFRILELFKQSGTHIAVVVDEYGVIQGLVTLNDVLVELVGDMPSIDQEEEPMAVQREDGSWLIDGMYAVEDFFELFGIKQDPRHQRNNYQTLAGLVITHLGRIPTAADHFDWQDFRFEVMDMDGNRVDKILVMPVPASSDAKTSSPRTAEGDK
ncbi:MAG: HlyC/CorC family transporter [Coleofasciculaceae cyanobacterium SM2_1_6]|nr:HlyC/CorC family transporter [Coleofasciculaceae cyanobacterium SM2_1_6]